VPHEVHVPHTPFDAGPRVVIATAAGDEPPSRVARVHLPAEARAAIAVHVASKELRGRRVCRTCALRVLETLVRFSVEDAERDLRRSFLEQMQCSN
jgi:hypothetical protein